MPFERCSDCLRPEFPPEISDWALAVAASAKGHRVSLTDEAVQKIYEENQTARYEQWREENPAAHAAFMSCVMRDC